MKRKIAILGPTPPYRGGIVHFNTKLNKELSQNDGLDVLNLSWKRLYPSILLPKPEKSFQDNESKDVIEVEQRKILDYMNPISWFKVVYEIKRFSPEIFITHWTQPIHFPVFWIIFQFVHLFTNTKIYLIAHNVQQHEGSFINKFTTKQIFRLVDKVVVHASSEAVAANKFVSKDRIISLFLPFSDIFTKDVNFNKNVFKKELGLKKNVILFFGFIRPYKGLEYLIKAFEKVQRELDDVSLLIVGELFWKIDENQKQSSWEKLKRLPFQIIKRLAFKDDVEKYDPLKLIDNLKLADNCVVVDNYVPNEDVYKYFLSSNVFVAPYVSASQSAVAQVAYSFDLPVILTDVGGLKDVVKDGYSGYLAKQKDTNDIANKIIKFFKCDEVNSRNVSIYKSNFSWETYINNILK